MAASPILMPKLGLTMTEGLLAQWRVAEGDEVRAGEVIFAVETDKITSEVEARADGRIEQIKVPVGETVPVGAVVATWTGPAQGEEDGEEESSPDNSPLPRPSPEARSIDAAGDKKRDSRLRGDNEKGLGAGKRIIATPYARKLAREAGVVLGEIEGTGPRGRIKAADVTTALQDGSAVEPGPVAIPSQVALSEVDCAAAIALCQRLAEAGGSVSLADLIARAAARSGHDVTLAPAAEGRAWLLPKAAANIATLALGPVQAQFRPDAEGKPALRQIAPIAVSAGNGADATAILDAIVQRLENPLKLLL